MKKPPKRPSSEQVEEDAPGAPNSPSSAPTGSAAAPRRPRAASRRGQIEPEQRQADRAEGHQADFNVLGRHALAEQRADADADGEGGQQQVTAPSPPPSTFLAKAGKLREEQRAVEPEPGDAENRQEDRAVLAREADVAPGFGQRIRIDDEIGYRRRRRRNAAAGDVAERPQPASRHRPPRPDRARHRRAGHRPACRSGWRRRCRPRPARCRRPARRVAGAAAGSRT